MSVIATFIKLQNCKTKSKEQKQEKGRVRKLEFEGKKERLEKR